MSPFEIYRKSYEALSLQFQGNINICKFVQKVELSSSDHSITLNFFMRDLCFSVAEIWDNVYNEFLGWARNSEQVNIIIGPAYDMDRNSKKDSYFKIAER